MGVDRTEVRDAKSDAHLDHVFDDGPGFGGMLYCINSAAVRFIPVEKLKREGYGQFLPVFELEAELLKKAGVGKAFLFPSLAGKGTGGKFGLSGQFAAIMARAGVIESFVPFFAPLI